MDESRVRRMFELYGTGVAMTMHLLYLGKVSLVVVEIILVVWLVLVWWFTRRD